MMTREEAEQALIENAERFLDAMGTKVMTRDEARAKCIDVIKAKLRERLGIHISDMDAETTFDSLHDIARVVPNKANIALKSNNTSGIKGVSRNARGSWTAQIQVSGVRKNLGRRKTKEEAAELYANAARQAFGEFARITNPPEKKV